MYVGFVVLLEAVVRFSDEGTDDNFILTRQIKTNDV